MQIRENGIYFRQVDQKEEGFYTEDNKGNLVHNIYKKPSVWERAKYFATYGVEMNLETIYTTYFYFLKDANKVFFETLRGNAISVAQEMKESRSFYNPSIYIIEGDVIKFETTKATFTLEFYNDGHFLKVNSKINSRNTLYSQHYTFLDWKNI